jgi:hypothetical protein
MRTRPCWLPLTLGAVLLLPGCATYHRRGLPPQQAAEIEQALVSRRPAFSREMEDRILALNPECVTDREVREVLAQAPAPRLINIHGGISPVHLRMVSFCEFLVGMGYPRASLTNPADGTYTFSCYESAAKVTGCIAWHYEKEGLRPLLVGHSQGGFQVVKVLRRLAGLAGPRAAVWNPLTWQPEDRHTVNDPWTGEVRPVAGLQLPYATAVGAGGLTRLLPNQWSLCGRLRSIPDSVEEFTGFFKGMDPLGGDWLGYGGANYFRPTGRAVVCNVRLPTRYRHGYIPNTKHLLKSQAMMDWINNYRPAGQPVSTPRLDAEFDADSRHILWAAEVWFRIKKHWVLELQRAIRASRSRRAVASRTPALEEACPTRAPQPPSTVAALVRARPTSRPAGSRCCGLEVRRALTSAAPTDKYQLGEAGPGRGSPAGSCGSRRQILTSG